MCIKVTRAGVLSVGMALVAVVAGVGCSLEMPTSEAAVSDGDGDTAIGEDTVFVRFWNRTVEEAVDVQFYATNEPLDTLPDDLFVEDNRVTRSIGLAGRGIIEPGMVDAISFPCTENLTLGTAGGEFTEAETGDERGLGTPRWAQQEPLGLCGSVVTFEFFHEGDQYGTRFRLED
jgi:hypothetical protein